MQSALEEVPKGTKIAIMPSSHLDLFWLGDYRNCLRRGDEVIKAYLDRALDHADETFVIDTAIFAEHFIASHPEYEHAVRRLLMERRLEIGAAYIDRGESLYLGESLIRNIQIGRRWAAGRLGFDATMAAHPDLPSFNAQTTQIYSQAGIRYYVTSRKVFQEGRVWKHRAPDGTCMLMLTWPIHYVFVPFTSRGLDEAARADTRAVDGSERRRGNFVGGRYLSFEDLSGRYPHGVVAISGSAGDLTGPEDFISRYGKDLREYIAEYREELPQVDISYSIPAEVMAPYLEGDSKVAEISGWLPSVWGVAYSEESRFYDRSRNVERLLLAAETASLLGTLRGLDRLPPEAAEWRGLYAEDAFFATDDLAPPGREWEWLWRMHVFTQDHNGGGQDGVLSSFHKKVRQDRLHSYADQVFRHVLQPDASQNPVLLTTRLSDCETLLRVEPDLGSSLRRWLLDQDPAGWQEAVTPTGEATVALNLSPVSGIGFQPLGLQGPSAAQPRVAAGSDYIRVETEFLVVDVNAVDGSLELTDTYRRQQWSGIMKGLCAIPETGTGVTLKTTEAGAISHNLCRVEIVSSGPLCTQVRIVQSLLDVAWVGLVTVWADLPRVDIEIDVQWPAFENWQVRLPLVAGARRESIAIGTPFHGSQWDEVPAAARPSMRDEITPADFEAYREAQHWLHVQRDRGALTIATQHPGFHHDSERSVLSAVLLRTPPSGGDLRMFWTNPGETRWRFELWLGEGDWVGAGAAELGDRSWRRPLIQSTGRQDTLCALANEGDGVQLSALYIDEDDGAPVARLANVSDTPAKVALVGELIDDVGQLADLDGNVVGTLTADAGRLHHTLDPWRIQTIKLLRNNEEST